MRMQLDLYLRLTIALLLVKSAASFLSNDMKLT
jgi:hypothetical protein